MHNARATDRPDARPPHLRAGRREGRTAVAARATTLRTHALVAAKRTVSVGTGARPTFRWRAARHRSRRISDEEQHEPIDASPGQEAWQALVAREREYRALLSNISCMVYRGSAVPPWQLSYVSDGVEVLTGYPPSYFLDEGHRWGEIMDPEDVGWVSEKLARSAAEGVEVRLEYRIRCRDGAVRWVEGRVRMFAGDPPVYSGTVFDIDERKRAEQALAESREHQRYIIESVPSSLWMAGPDGGIDFVSSAGRTYRGASIEQRLGYGWLTFVHPDDRGRVGSRWAHSLATGEPYDAAFRQSDLEGGYRFLQARAICRRGADGRIVRWYGTTTDVTELVRMQRQLHESEELSSATIQTVPGMVWRADAAGRMTFISDACEAQLGWSPEEVLDDRWWALVHPEDAPGLSCAWREALKTGDPIDVRYRVRNRQGVYRWHQVRAIAGRDAEGQVARWNGLAIDIEDLHQARLAAESAMRAKSAFLSTMSHEIRTPLNAVLGYAGLLSDTALSAEQREFVKAIRGSGDHLLEVINDILDFSKLESGGVGLDFARCDVREVVESAIDLVAHQAAAKELELYSHIEDAVPAECWADPARIRQVLVNLLGNAVKFTPAGEVEVKVAVRSLGAGDVEFEFRVRDTGIGIAADKMTHLFRDFSQVDDSIARRYGGTGLGLAISKRLVEAHGGYIRATSEPGRGSTFAVFLPAKPCEPTPALGNGPGPLHGRTALVVDDHGAALEALCSLLRRWGMQVTGTTEPERVLAMFEAPPAETSSPRFDVLIVDQRMPRIPGSELARRCRAVTDVPTVLLTPLGTMSEAGPSAEASGWVRVSKPVRSAELHDALCRLVQVSADAAPAAPAATPAAAERVPPLSLLVVEDNPTNRRVAQLLLRRLGYADVDLAADGREAVAAVRRGRYDVVLMDVQMPELDGLQATRAIRQALPAALQPQIIALTANATAEDREACLLCGMDSYLAKPIDATRLGQSLLAAAERLRDRRGGPRTD